MKLKPAKQALADAIHQNGGWRERALWASQDHCIAFFSGGKPSYNRGDGCWYSNARNGSCVYSVECDAKIKNWHQCILSRDEYFTAYPEQVKDEVNNETEHKVEVEMKSESEMTIKVGSDWHKNGELPPVGEEVMLNSTNPNDYWAHHVGSKLTVVAHDKDSHGVGIAVYRFIDAGGYNEYHGLVARAFKPLRSERDKAIDEMVSLVEPLATYKAFAGAIYDAGYRKEVK